MPDHSSKVWTTEFKWLGFNIRIWKFYEGSHDKSIFNKLVIINVKIKTYKEKYR